MTVYVEVRSLWKLALQHLCGYPCVANPKPYIKVAAWFQRCIFMAKRFPTFLIWCNLRLSLPIAKLCDYNHIFFLEFFLLSDQNSMLLEHPKQFLSHRNKQIMEKHLGW